MGTLFDRSFDAWDECEGERNAYLAVLIERELLFVYRPLFIDSVFSELPTGFWITCPSRDYCLIWLVLGPC